MPDSHLQDGASAAAAAGGAAGRPGERHGAHAPGETHQRAAGAHGRAAGVRVDGGQLRGAADEDAQPHPLHAALGPAARLPLEALGVHLTVPGPLPAAPQMTGQTRLDSSCLRQRSHTHPPLGRLGEGVGGRGMKRERDLTLCEEGKGRKEGQKESRKEGSQVK